MKTLSRWSGSAMLCFLLTGCATGLFGSRPAPYAEILGTWKGHGYGDQGGAPVEMTLVLQEKDGVFTGYLSIPEQGLESASLDNLRYEDRNLTCSVRWGNEMMGYSITVMMNLNLEDEELRGWFSSEVVSGEIVLKRSPGQSR